MTNTQTIAESLLPKVEYDPRKHRWFVERSGEDIRIACDKCGDVLTPENEEADCFWHEL